MASLTGKQIRNSYDGLLKTQDNGAVTATEKPVTDGLGNATVLSIGTSTATFNGNVTATSFVKSGGTSSQFLKADGSVDSTTYQDVTEKGAALGYVPLNAGAKIDESYLPDSVVGQVEYQGTWNASTNTPTLPFASTVKGHFYIVSTAGTYLTIDYAVGDWIISDGSSWSKVDNTDAVTNFNGRLGGIIPIESDYSSFFYTKTLLDGGQLDTRYYTESESNSRFVNVTGDVMSGSLTATSFNGDGSGLTNVFNAKSELGSSENLNNFRTTGYMSQNSNPQAAAGSNYPTSSAGILEVINDDTGNGVHTVQRYSRYNAPEYYVRYYYNGSWGSWTRFLTTSDEGSGNGLDADTVDSKHATDFTLDYVTGNGATTSNGVTIGSLSATNGTFSGNVGIGTSSPSSQLQSYKVSTVNVGATANASLSLASDGVINTHNTITFGKQPSGSYAPAYIGYITTDATGNSKGDIILGARSVTTDSAPTERMRIDSSGNITQTASGNPQFTISGSAGAYTGILQINAAGGGGSKIQTSGGTNSLSIETGGSESMRIDSSGRVLIGTNTAATSTATLDAITIGKIGSTSSSIIFTDGSSTRWGFIYSNATKNTIGSFGDVTFESGATASERMRLDSSGRLGIGTTTPSGTLDVRPNASCNYVFTGTSTSGYTTTLNMDNVGLDIGHNSTARSLNLKTGSADRLTITGGGNVGIGTTSPTTGKLVVHDGDIEVRDSTGNSGGRIKALDNYHAIYFREGGRNRTNYYQYGGTLSAGLGHRFLTGGTSQSLRMQIADDGIYMANDVGIGTTSPSYKLDVTGTIRASSDIIAFSDARVKENVKTIDNALDKVTQLRGVSYNKIGETEEKIGVIAQEVEKVLPQVVSTDDDGMKAVAYANMVGLLIEAVKEQQKQIDELKTMLNA